MLVITANSLLSSFSVSISGPSTLLGCSSCCVLQEVGNVIVIVEKYVLREIFETFFWLSFVYFALCF